MAENENINSTLELIDTEVYEQDIRVVDETDQVIVETEMQTIEVFEEDVSVVESDNAFSPIGEPNELLRHTLLTEREADDQHPITAITGLRAELDEIEKLKTVYSDKKNHANYYQWEDGNAAKEDRVGYFVSVCADEIKLCTLESDVFGVTVDSAGFVGSQSDIEKDEKYGLVASNGLVLVRCELSVDVGDYVISNDYGYAQKSDFGFVVVSRQKINGIEYAGIALTTPINRICKLSANIEGLDGRMSDAEKNIISAINASNAAYKKAEEASNISQNANNNASNALDKVNGVVEKTNELESNISSAQEVAVQAKAVAESAAVSAETIRKEAVKTANQALSDVNDLIEDLEPITTWSDPESGNTGAEYFATYVKNGVATKAEVQTVETLTNDNKSVIERNAENFRTLIASVDKYSIGEYSQAYGLTHEQAKSILKVGMVYIPFGSLDGTTHIEEYEGQGQENEFTECNHYIWTGEDWEEYIGSVVFSKEEPTQMNSLRYWYVNSDEAPEGYEPKTLYMAKDGKWVKVNVFYGNPNNRITSSISQEVDRVSLEIVNTRGSIAAIDMRLTDTETEVQTVTQWMTDPNGETYNLATIKQTANDAGASIAQVVESVGKDGKVSAASIVTAINEGTSGVTISADRINLAGAVTIGSLDNDTRNKLNNSIQSTVIEYALSDSATVAPTSGWNSIAPQWQENKYMWQKTTIQYTDSSKAPTVTVTCIQGAKGEKGDSGAAGKDGTGVSIKGSAYVKDITVSDNIIGQSYYLYTDSAYSSQIINSQSGDAYLVDGYLFVYNNSNKFICTGKIQGPKGDTGAKGDKGDTGEQGVQGEAGKDGVDGNTPYVGTNGTWWIGDVDTTVKAKGEDGKTPTVEINADGFWVINGIVSNVQAIGKDGANGVSVVRVVTEYIISTSKTSAPSNNNTSWTDNFDAILATYNNEKKNSSNMLYIWSREKVEYSYGNPTYSIATVQSANSAIVNWCYENDVTKINGANIATGTITADQIDVQDLSALKSTIGGWKIDGNGIHSNTSSYKVDLWAPSEDANTAAQWIFMFTDNTGETPTYPFVVRKDGTLLAERANIGGWGINSGTSGLVKKNDDFEVHIKAPTKHGGYGNGAADFIVLADKTGDVVDYPFVVSSDGSLFATKVNITGNVTAKSGKIGNWSIGSVGLYKHGPGYTPDPNASESDKIYFGMSYEGSVYLLPEGGTNSGYMIGGHVTTADDLWVFAISNTFGITKKGSLYASDASFVGNDTSGVTLSRQNTAHSVRIQNRYYEDDTNKNGIGEATFLDPKGIGYQYRPQNSSRKTFKQMIEFGYNNTNGYYGVLGGTWYLTSAEGSKVTSDQTKKNSIAPQSEIYSQIFDKLNPVTFKYNHGTSNRTHMGLIAQEVEEAALSSGVDTKDFAVVCYDVDENGNKIDYGIRYTELISMSIYEIQKLKARVAELEAKLENKEN